MATKKKLANPRQLDRLIYEIRGQKIMLDVDLAEVYGVPTKRLNEQIKRNRERFPGDFAFRLTAKEMEVLRSQIATASAGRSNMRSQIATASKRNIRYLPWVFTEHGAIMAANVLNSPRAVQMSVFVVRAFLRMRGFLGDRSDLAQKLASLEEELKKRLDVHEVVIVTILQRVMDIIDPPQTSEPTRPRIGFNP